LKIVRTKPVVNKTRETIPPDCAWGRNDYDKT
jgi:hypothetical protein